MTGLLEYSIPDSLASTYLKAINKKGDEVLLGSFNRLHFIDLDENSLMLVEEMPKVLSTNARVDFRNKDNFIILDPPYLHWKKKGFLKTIELNSSDYNIYESRDFVLNEDKNEVIIQVQLRKALDLPIGERPYLLKVEWTGEESIFPITYPKLYSSRTFGNPNPNLLMYNGNLYVSDYLSDSVHVYSQNNSVKAFKISSNQVNHDNLPVFNPQLSSTINFYWNDLTTYGESWIDGDTAYRIVHLNTNNQNIGKTSLLLIKCLKTGLTKECFFGTDLSSWKLLQVDRNTFSFGRIAKDVMKLMDFQLINPNFLKPNTYFNQYDDILQTKPELKDFSKVLIPAYSLSTCFSCKEAYQNFIDTANNFVVLKHKETEIEDLVDFPVLDISEEEMERTELKRFYTSFLRIENGEVIEDRIIF